MVDYEKAAKTLLLQDQDPSGWFDWAISLISSKSLLRDLMETLLLIEDYVEIKNVAKLLSKDIGILIRQMQTKHLSFFAADVAERSLPVWDSWQGCPVEYREEPKKALKEIRTSYKFPHTARQSMCNAANSARIDGNIHATFAALSVVCAINTLRYRTYGHTISTTHHALGSWTLQAKMWKKEKLWQKERAIHYLILWEKLD